MGKRQWRRGEHLHAGSDPLDEDVHLVAGRAVVEDLGVRRMFFEAEEGHDRLDRLVGHALEEWHGCQLKLNGLEDL